MKVIPKVKLIQFRNMEKRYNNAADKNPKKRRTNIDSNIDSNDNDVDMIDDDNHITQNRIDSKMPDKYENCIFIAGNKEIHFNAHVDGDTITRLKKLISIVVNENKDKLVKYDDGVIPYGREKDPPVIITYIVNSPGGSVHDVLDFVDYIGILRNTFVNIKFTSIITGMVASAGTIMCIIADKRQMTRFAFAMIHELSTGLSRANYTRIMTHAEFIKQLHDVLVLIYLECRKIPLDDIAKRNELELQLKNETWMTAEQYREGGFVDEIIASRR